MSLVDSTTERFLRIAVARWPEELRDDQSREWAAELYAIRHDGDGGRWRRAWTQLRFSFSLAASPPVDDPDKIPQGWREVMPRLGLALRRCLMLVGVGLLCLIGVQTSDVVAGAWTELTPDPTAVPDGITAVTSLLAVALVVAGAGWLGQRLGRTMPLRVRPGRHGGAAVAVIVMACLVAGANLHLLAQGADGFAMSRDQLLGFAALVPAAVLVGVLAGRGGAGRARWWGVGAGLLSLEVVSIPLAAWNTYVGVNDTLSPYAGAKVAYFDFPASLLWFPESLVWNGVPPGGLAQEVEMWRMSGLAGMMPLLLTVGAFALTYLIRAAAAEPIPAAAPRPAVAAAAVPSWRRQSGLALAGLGIVVWAALLSFTAWSGSRTEDFYEDAAVLWVIESRNWAIVLAGLGLAWALSGRTRVLLPSVAFGAGMLGIDAVADRADLVGIGAFLVSAGVAGALAVAAWWIPTKLDTQPLDPGSVRRTVVAIAVLAGYSAPAVLSPARDVSGSWLLADPPVIAVVLSVAFVAVAAAAAITGRDRAVARGPAIAIIAVPAAILVVVGLATGYALPGPGIFVTAALCVPVVVYLTAVMHWDRGDRTGKDVLRWVAAGLGAAVVGALLMYPQLLAADTVGGALFELRGHAPGHIPQALFTGFFLGALAYAIVVALVTVRRPRREAAVATGGSASGEIVSA